MKIKEALQIMNAILKKREKKSVTWKEGGGSDKYIKKCHTLFD